MQETTHSQRQLEKAAMLFRNNSFSESEQVCRGIIDRDPFNLAARNLLPGIMRHCGRLAEAVEIMNQLTTIAPNIPELHVNHGDLLLETGNPDLAEQCYRRAISLRAHYPKAWFQ